MNSPIVKEGSAGDLQANTEFRSPKINQGKGLWMAIELATGMLWTSGWYEEVQETKLHQLQFCRVFQLRIRMVREGKV